MRYKYLYYNLKYKRGCVNNDNKHNLPRCKRLFYRRGKVVTRRKNSSGYTGCPVHVFLHVVGGAIMVTHAIIAHIEYCQEWKVRNFHSLRRGSKNKGP